MNELITKFLGPSTSRIHLCPHVQVVESGIDDRQLNIHTIREESAIKWAFAGIQFTQKPVTIYRATNGVMGISVPLAGSLAGCIDWMIIRQDDQASTVIRRIDLSPFKSIGFELSPANSVCMPDEGVVFLDRNRNPVLAITNSLHPVPDQMSSV